MTSLHNPLSEDDKTAVLDEATSFYIYSAEYGTLDLELYAKVIVLLLKNGANPNLGNVLLLKLQGHSHLTGPVKAHVDPLRPTTGAHGTWGLFLAACRLELC